MPRLSIYFVRAALIYLSVGATIGGALLWQKGAPPAGPLWRLLPAHIELILIGWILQLVMGVAYWILPRFGNGRPRGRPGLAWSAFALLNAGLLAVTVSSISGAAAGWHLAGTAAEAAGVALFAISIFPRIKPFAEEPETTNS